MTKPQITTCIITSGDTSDGHDGYGCVSTKLCSRDGFYADALLWRGHDTWGYAYPLWPDTSAVGGLPVVRCVKSVDAWDAIPDEFRDSLKDISDHWNRVLETLADPTKLLLLELSSI